MLGVDKAELIPDSCSGDSFGPLVARIFSMLATWSGDRLVPLGASPFTVSDS